MKRRLSRWGRVGLFVYLSALIVVCFSERVFWFWTPGIVEHLEGALFYSLPTGVLIWVLARYRVATGWGLLAAAPLYAYVTEGVITPVVYSGGPFVPFFPAWFAAWHGLGAAVVCWFVIRRWLLDRQRRHLTLLSIGIGTFWGVWASTSRLPEQVDDTEMIEDVGVLVVLGPGRFGLYASMVTAVLIGAHLALGYAWPDGPRAGRPTGWVLAALCLTGATVWTFVFPWALPMFLLYVWLQVRVLRRSASSSGSSPLLDSLAGRVRVVDALPLVLIAPSAALVYAALWEVDPSDTVLRTIYYATIAVQTVIGAVVMVMSWRRSPARAASAASPRRSAPLGTGAR